MDEVRDKAREAKTSPHWNARGVVHGQLSSAIPSGPALRGRGPKQPSRSTRKVDGRYGPTVRKEGESFAVGSYAWRVATAGDADVMSTSPGFLPAPPMRERPFQRF